jgi:hypothetical protein
MMIGMTGREAALENRAQPRESPVGGPARDAAPTDPAAAQSMADVVERLATVFDGRVRRPVIVAVVRRCRRELDIVSGPPLPEMLERLAHQRLTRLAPLDKHRRTRR